jgi:multiple sugar transport system substrate-binding protein
MDKKIISLFLSVFLVTALAVPGLFAAGGSDRTASGGKALEIEFWYHDGNQISTETYEPIMDAFNKSQDKYRAAYVGIPVDSYLQKINTAIATNTKPAVLSVRTSDVVAFSKQKAIIPLDDAFNSWAEKDYIDNGLVEFVKALGGGPLYGIPVCYNMDISWYNTKKFRDKGIAGPPKTIDEFLSLCQRYADPRNGEYFYSFRGVDPINNFVNFVFTYVGATSFFDNQGNCIINQPEFAEGFEKYVSIYWNGWVSQNSVTNGYQQIVAEFASGSSMFLNHNSSSLPDHLKNLGDGNFSAAEFPRNNRGEYVYTVAQPQTYGVCTGTPELEAAGIALNLFMANEASVSRVSDVLGRLPAHSKVFSHDWYKNNQYLDIYAKIASDPTVKVIQLPLWLPVYSEFRNRVIQSGLQAVMLKEKTIQQTLNEWAEYLTKAQKEYLAGLK